ncbi:hypothetical protein BCR37DRAFT_101889 [Protomyces lactucae-debilis]|uniref:Uncharacterized protein n=1 Tax=Protomyces lactucae-debilis TaxID=2754530 RepID=A0A1Y2F5W0_PROLT|nr:uncharacterized protein BCR37DRAFT_101889 [Protomyces lactucae-debilis]ORY79047.1 hypothetical protein BCR37DRAFT_101889 [Protomyces lactucae-debilis]
MDRTQSYHSRQSSVGSSFSRPLSAQQADQVSYVQRMRIAKGTVWAERGPKDAVNEQRKQKVAQTKKRGFGMKMFHGAPPAQQARTGKSKLQPYAAPQHTTLIPRLSASEANDDNDQDFDNFTSSANYEAKRTSAAPSLSKSSLRRYPTSTHNSTFTPDVPSVPTSPVGLTRLNHLDSGLSSGANSSAQHDMPFPAPNQTSFGFGSTSGFATSRSGSPTQLQQYTQQHIPDDSDDEESRYHQPRQKLFIANADISDSD